MQTFGIFYDEKGKGRPVAHIERGDNPFWPEEVVYNFRTSAIVRHASRQKKDGAGNYTPYAHALAVLAYRIDKCGHFAGQKEVMVNSVKAFRHNLFCGCPNLRAFWESFMWDESAMPFADFERAYNTIERYYFRK